MARRRGTAPLRPQPGRARRRGPVVTARPPPSHDPPSRPRAVRSAAAATPDLGARRLLSLEREGQRVLTLLAPGIELVRFEARFPGVLGLVLGAGVPVGAPQLVVRLDQVRPELEGFLEEGLGVLVHLALQVDQPEIEVGVKSRLLVVVEPDRLREVLDGLAEDALLQTDVPDVDPGERVRRLLHQDLLEGAERVVVVLVQHLRPAEERFRLRLSGGELQRFLQRLDRPRVVAEGDETPPLFDEGRRPDVVRVDRGAVPVNSGADASAVDAATCLKRSTSLRTSSLSADSSPMSESTCLKYAMISRFTASRSAPPVTVSRRRAIVSYSLRRAGRGLSIIAPSPVPGPPSRARASHWTRAGARC